VTHSSASGPTGASLHSKAFVVDHQTLFVGSFNLDQRSTWLNCEQGVLVENTRLAAQLETMFTTQTAGDRAWRVTLAKGDMIWSDGNETFYFDPKTSFGGVFKAWFARMLHLEAQL